MSQDSVAPSSTFNGWIGFDKNAIKGNLVHTTFEPKPFTDNDIDVEITHCGVCASDLHTLRSGWAKSDYPVVVGHEIVGNVIRKGKNVNHLNIGDRVGIGAQSSSCLACDECKTDNEQYCDNMVQTYNDRYPDGSKTYGGYATHGRFPAAFAFPIPDSLQSAIAAPMLCGGVTMYSPLKRYGAGPGKSVGIVGIGGLGHFGVLFASALGCDNVVAVSRSRSKEVDVKVMGANKIIATQEENWDVNNAATLDLIVCTANDPEIEVSSYALLLRRGGILVQVGAPEDVLKFNPMPLIFKNRSIAGTVIGSRKEIKEMLELAVKKNIKSWIQEYPMDQVNKVIVKMNTTGARYRYVLVN
ncbi:chaperonin 10-like protein [Lipomyces japonicus]|uniref:chaperonin 10-like protein n=1 Tax=Lipomyces japonicus TaxID=56871 RepID=UPI0034CFAD8D